MSDQIKAALIAGVVAFIITGIGGLLWFNGTVNKSTEHQTVVEQHLKTQLDRMESKIDSNSKGISDNSKHITEIGNDVKWIVDLNGRYRGYSQYTEPDE